jgi:hypothetical protein
VRIIVRMPAMFQHTTDAEVVLDDAVDDIVVCERFSRVGFQSVAGSWRTRCSVSP